ncbi:MAG: hypothetical protein ABW117_17775 [Candidatus Sedimenticola sp. 1PA]
MNIWFPFFDLRLWLVDELLRNLSTILANCMAENRQQITSSRLNYRYPWLAFIPSDQPHQIPWAELPAVLLQLHHHWSAAAIPGFDSF